MKEMDVTFPARGEEFVERSTGSSRRFQILARDRNGADMHRRVRTAECRVSEISARDISTKALQAKRKRGMLRSWNRLSYEQAANCYTFLTDTP